MAADPRGTGCLTTCAEIGRRTRGGQEAMSSRGAHHDSFRRRRQARPVACGTTTKGRSRCRRQRRWRKGLPHRQTAGAGPSCLRRFRAGTTQAARHDPLAVTEGDRRGRRPRRVDQDAHLQRRTPRGRPHVPRREAPGPRRTCRSARGHGQRPRRHLPSERPGPPPRMRRGPCGAGRGHGSQDATVAGRGPKPLPALGRQGRSPRPSVDQVVVGSNCCVLVLGSVTPGGGVGGGVWRAGGAALVLACPA